jgi:hypothetical protein
MEDAMLKRLWISAAFCALVSAPVAAQQQEAMLKRLDVLA